MPFKRNPENAETMGSLARLVAALPRVAWDNAAHSLLERTLDDSASQRLILPEAFLLSDELLLRAQRILGGLVVQTQGILRNMEAYGTFAATERLLMELVKAGADRQEMHEVIRIHSMAAWDSLQEDVAAGNPLPSLMAAEPAMLAFLPASRILELLDAAGYVGDAPERAQAMARLLHRAVELQP
jgi:adenylosuccinate lyase